MRRSVLRWSMAMMENTWLSVAMSSSAVRALVAYVIYVPSPGSEDRLDGRLPDEVGERPGLAGQGELGQQGGAGDARLDHG